MRYSLKGFRFDPQDPTIVLWCLPGESPDFFSIHRKAMGEWEWIADFQNFTPAAKALYALSHG